MSGESVHAQEHPPPCAYLLMQGERGNPVDDEAHRVVVADVERHRPAKAATS